MKNPFFIYILFLSFFISNVTASSIQDSKGTFSIDYIPKRVVALELSFVDALNFIDIKPIGIADDNDKNRLNIKLRESLGAYSSVGTRSQPSLEVIASLKPDLIIADIRRHEAVLKSLQKIAPTVILPSKRAAYSKYLEVSKKLAKIFKKEDLLEKRVQKHKEYLKSLVKKLPKDYEFQIALARDDAFFLQTPDSFYGELLQSLGFKYARSYKNNDAPRYTSLEQLLAINPQYLILGEYINPSIIKKWQEEPLWRALKISKKGHIIKIKPSLWSRSRGFLSSELFIENLVSKLGK